MAVRTERMPTGFNLTAAELDRASKSRPHTPPYTPNRSKVRLERADSPAPSIHPTETVSPLKKGVSSVELPDTILVQELVEGHPEYTTSVELVYPDELEEFDSEADIGDVSDSDGDISDNGISGGMAQLQCEDKQGEARMERSRRDRREMRRLGQRHFKRTHSESIKSDSETTDVDAMDDHDHPGTARRLRRRTQGPDAMDVLSPRVANGSPLSTSPTPGQRAAISSRHKTSRDTISGDDSDDSDDMMNMNA